LASLFAINIHWILSQLGQEVQGLFFGKISMRASAARMGAVLTLQIRRHHRACPGDPRLASCFS
jgi:hypothetical protein